MYVDDDDIINLQRRQLIYYLKRRDPRKRHFRTLFKKRDTFFDITNVLFLYNIFIEIHTRTRTTISTVEHFMGQRTLILLNIKTRHAAVGNPNPTGRIPRAQSVCFGARKMFTYFFNATLVIL